VKSRRRLQFWGCRSECVLRRSGLCRARGRHLLCTRGEPVTKGLVDCDWVLFDLKAIEYHLRVLRERMERWR
jgi:hypothetical protein